MAIVTTPVGEGISLLYITDAHYPNGVGNNRWLNLLEIVYNGPIGDTRPPRWMEGLRYTNLFQTDAT